jgi:hypothetical protein
MFRFILTVCCAVAAILTTGFARGADEVPAIPPAKNWEQFVILVWQFQTDVTKDKALYEAVHLHGLHIDRSNAGLAEFARDNKWPFYVDHTADKGYLHLGNRANEVVRKKEILQRPNSLADPATITKMKGFIRQNISSAKGSPVVAYALDDEVSLGSFCSPSEIDGAPASVAGYRKSLQAMYGSIDKLNTQYGTKYPSFDAIQPLSFEQFRNQLEVKKLPSLNLSQWCDWRGYMDTQFADCLGDLTRYANTLDENTPTGFVGGQSPNAWGGYDYRKLSKAAQWMEAYDIGGSNEILRSFWSQQRPHVQTFFSSKNPHQDAWFLWYYLCHGNRGVIAWPEGWFNSGKVAPHIQANAATFAEVQGPLSQKIINGTFVADPVAIYYSHPSIQVTWALDAACHKGTWPNRSSSMDNSLSTSNLTRIGWLKSLEDIGIQARFIHQDHLLGGQLAKDKYKVLILNRAICLSDGEAQAIRDFSKQGGTVIDDQLCGVCDEHGKMRPVGVLDDLFGVKHDLSRGFLGGETLTEVDGERGGSFNAKTWAIEMGALHLGLPVYERGLSAIEPAKAEGTYGTTVANVHNQQAIYLNVSPLGYLLQRDKGEGAAWTEFLTGMLKTAGVESRLQLTEAKKPAQQLESLFWQNGPRTTLCVVKNLDRGATINSFWQPWRKEHRTRLALCQAGQTSRQRTDWKSSGRRQGVRRYLHSLGSKRLHV